MPRRKITLLLTGLMVAAPCVAAPRPPSYYDAENVFNNETSLRDRVIEQVLLITTGGQTIVPTERLTLNAFNATREFQIANRLSPSGILNRDTYDRLIAVASPLLDMWDFRMIPHPSRGRPIWIPQGMGLQAYPSNNGLSFKEPSGRIQVAYNYFPNTALEFVYNDLILKKKRDGTTIHFSVIKEGWFVISATSIDGTDEYLRYHQDGYGITGFALLWRNMRGNVSGERIATLMSASLGAVMNGRPFIEPPTFKQAQPSAVITPPVAAIKQSSSVLQPAFSGETKIQTPQYLTYYGTLRRGELVSKIGQISFINNGFVGAGIFEACSNGGFCSVDVSTTNDGKFFADRLQSARRIATFDSPESIIRFIYKQLTDDKYFHLEDDDLTQIYDAELATTVKQHRVDAAKNEEETFDNPWWLAQDGSPMNIQITSTSLGDGAAIVRVTYTNSIVSSDEVTKTNFEVVKKLEGWRISEIKIPDYKNGGLTSYSDRIKPQTNNASKK